MTEKIVIRMGVVMALILAIMSLTVVTHRGEAIEQQHQNASGTITFSTISPPQWEGQGTGLSCLGPENDDGQFQLCRSTI